MLIYFSHLSRCAYVVGYSAKKKERPFDRRGRSLNVLFVFVSALAWDGNAENCGFNEKDVIVRIGERKVKKLEDVKTAYEEALASIGERTRVAVEIARGGRPAALVLDYTEDTEKED